MSSPRCVPLDLGSRRRVLGGCNREGETQDRHRHTQSGPNGKVRRAGGFVTVITQRDDFSSEVSARLPEPGGDQTGGPGAVTTLGTSPAANLRQCGSAIGDPNELRRLLLRHGGGHASTCSRGSDSGGWRPSVPMGRRTSSRRASAITRPMTPSTSAATTSPPGRSTGMPTDTPRSLSSSTRSSRPAPGVSGVSRCGARWRFSIPVARSWGRALHRRCSGSRPNPS